MKIPIPKGTTSKLLHVFIQDATVVTGEGLTGLTSTTAGLTCYYWREGDSAATQIVLASATLGTWTSGGFKEMDPSAMPGWYELGVPNAVLASGAATAKIHLRGALNGLGQLMMVPCPLEIELTAQSDQTAIGLKRNAAFTGLQFIMTDSGTHQPVTGKTVTVTRSIDGGAFSAGGITNVAEIGSGWYKFDGAASDVNGAFIAFRATASGCDDTNFTVITVP